VRIGVSERFRKVLRRIKIPPHGGRSAHPRTAQASFAWVFASIRKVFVAFAALVSGLHVGGLYGSVIFTEPELPVVIPAFVSLVFVVHEGITGNC
jgi:hypothetical protein